MVSVQPEASVIVALPTKDGGDLSLQPGREVVARVVAVDPGGAARISLAGQTVEVVTNTALQPGDQLRLAVARADAGGVQFRIVPDAAAPPPAAASSSSLSGAGSAAIRGVISELARAGVPISAEVAQSVARVAAQLGDASSGAARAVASLAGRETVLSPIAAGRVVAALDLAGSIGPALASLASRSPQVAAALPTGPPDAAALRGLLAPNLAPVELAVARIAIASSEQAQAADADATASQSTARSNAATAAIPSYVASQLASTALPGAGPAGSGASVVATPGAVALPDASARLAQDAAPANRLLQAATQGLELGRAAATGSPASASAAAEASGARTQATSAAAAGAASAATASTNPGAARAIADLGLLAARVVASTITPGGGSAIASDERGGGRNAAAVAQQLGRDGSIGRQVASHAGAGASGDPAPIVTAVREYLASAGAEQDGARLLKALSGATAGAVASALQSLPESQSLKLAGDLLNLLGSASNGSGAADGELRRAIHGALDSLGRSLQHAAANGAGDDLAALRRVLEQVMNQDPRPSVAGDAARLLAAVDGQQLLSRSTMGADPGYVYFQVPLPGGHGAEVMVRREPGRRQVTFDEFNIAFLLDTEQLGTLMIQLDARPTGIRADVRTDRPALEPFLRAHAETLTDPLGREARRPVVVTTGVFDQAPPRSLLDEPHRSIDPGDTSLYA